MIGFDCTARIDPAALHAAGCNAMIRYITPQTSAWPKSLTTSEAHELLAAGFPVVANYETYANRMNEAAAAGHADALESLANLAALGAPGGLTVWFSADWDVQPTQVINVLDYLHAAADVLGGKRYVGCYGGFRMVGAAADAGFPIWQTLAWSNGRWDPRTAARQTGEQRVVGGVQVDVNTISNLAALGAWTPGTTPSGGTTMGTIPSSIASQDPDLPQIGGMFPAGAQFDDATATIWADERAAAANIHAKLGLDAVHALSQLTTSDDAAAAAHLQAVSDAIAALSSTVQQLGTMPPVQVGQIGWDYAAMAAALAPELAARMTLTVGSK